MKYLAIKRVLDSLIAMKASIRDVADTSVNENLDEAIRLLEQYIENGSCDNNYAVLVVIGKLLEKFPSIVALLKLFSD